MAPLGPAAPPPPLLYKYVSSAPWHLDILRTLRIRFTQPEELNDLEDCKPEVVPPADLAGFVDASFARNAAVSRAKGLTQEQVKVARDSLLAKYQADPEELAIRYAPTIYKHLNIVGVLSLSESFDSQTMWAHYAESHAGFVIGFEPTFGPFVRRPTDAPDTGEPRRVSYSPNRVKVSVEPLVIPPDMLFVKDVQWSSEAEWRVVRTLAGCDHKVTNAPGKADIWLCDIDPRAVSRVLVGARASQQTIDAILAATASGTPLQHVQVFHAQTIAGRLDFQAKRLR